MESASENAGRGRPPKFNPASLEYIRKMHGGSVTSKRQLQNLELAYSALNVIVEEYGDSNHEDLHDSEGRLAFLWTKMQMKAGILAELGRIKDERPEVFYSAVEWVLENRPNTKLAIPALRRLRNGQSTPGSVLGLHGALIDSLNAYTQQHPGMNHEQIEGAVLLLSEAVSEKNRREDT